MVCLLIYDEIGEQEWIIGLINISNGNVRLELVKEHNTEIMKKIIKAHLSPNNNIISDG